MDHGSKMYAYKKWDCLYSQLSISTILQQLNSGRQI
jgi:hypothetical protein